VKHRYICCYVLFLILLSVPLAAFAQANAPSKPLTPLEQALISAEKSFIDAAKKGDAAFLKRTLTDDFSFVGFDGQLADRQEMIDQLSAGGVDLLAYDTKVISVSDDVAIVTYDVVLRVPPSEDEGPPPRYQHFSTVWVKQGEVWKMKFQQQSVAHWGDW
jgi:ketosteroid isomerase-like protein